MEHDICPKKLLKPLALQMRPLIEDMLLEIQPEVTLNFKSFKIEHNNTEKFSCNTVYEYTGDIEDEDNLKLISVVFACESSFDDKTKKSLFLIDSFLVFSHIIDSGTTFASFNNNNKLFKEKLDQVFNQIYVNYEKNILLNGIKEQQPTILKNRL